MKTSITPLFQIPVNFIIELGLIRKRGKCAKCGKDMDVPKYNIQLCMACREVELVKYADIRNIKTKRTEVKK